MKTAEDKFNTNSEIGSIHWFNTLTSKIARMGDYISRHCLPESKEQFYGHEILNTANFLITNYKEPCAIQPQPPTIHLGVPFKLGAKTFVATSDHNGHNVAFSEVDCPAFSTDTHTTSATVCQSCGREKWQHGGGVSGSVPNDRKKYMRNQATTIFELTKGFTGEPTSNAMKSALEMAGYVQELTTDVE